MQKMEQNVSMIQDTSDNWWILEAQTDFIVSIRIFIFPDRRSKLIWPSIFAVWLADGSTHLVRMQDWHNLTINMACGRFRHVPKGSFCTTQQKRTDQVNLRWNSRPLHGYLTNRLNHLMTPQLEATSKVVFYSVIRQSAALKSVDLAKERWARWFTGHLSKKHDTTQHSEYETA